MSNLNSLVKFTAFNTNCKLMLHPELERPSMKIAMNKQIRPFLRRFMIPTLDKAIEMNEPIEHLNEMRQVVIVFVNLVTDETSDTLLVDVANETFTEIFK